MMRKIKVLRSMVFLGFLFSALLSYGQTTIEAHVKVMGMRSGKGNIILTVFKDNQSFEKKQPLKNLVFDKKAISGGSMVMSFRIEPGTYGITLLDDENSNGKMDKTFIIMPKEGFGFSNFFMEKMRRPQVLMISRLIWGQVKIWWRLGLSIYSICGV